MNRNVQSAISWESLVTSPIQNFVFLSWVETGSPARSLSFWMVRAPHLSRDTFQVSICCQKSVWSNVEHANLYLLRKSVRSGVEYPLVSVCFKSLFDQTLNPFSSVRLLLEACSVKCLIHLVARAVVESMFGQISRSKSSACCRKSVWSSVEVFSKSQSVAKSMFGRILSPLK